jgi:UDP-2,3-diacylglucosamine pyrophosphatase LpxH
VCMIRIGPALDKVLAENEKRFELTEDAQFVIFSDLHRGRGDWADDFMHNSLIFTNALDFYFREGVTYIELGDGDELYENRHLDDIVRAHESVFLLLDKFHKENRLFYIVGNHNLQMGNERWRSRELEAARTHIPDLFDNLVTYVSALIGDRIFLFHGHQGDFFNDSLFPVARFFVRYFWRPLQNIFGWRDPTSPAQSIKKRNKVELSIMEWARKNRIVAVAGHTHRPIFMSLTKQQNLAGMKSQPYYFNSGCGIHPRCVTCLEISGMKISLVKWHIVTDTDEGGQLKVAREQLEGCQADLKDVLDSL